MTNQTGDVCILSLGLTIATRHKEKFPYENI
jgi:hypothetical protein